MTNKTVTTKAQLAELVANDANLTKKQASIAIDAVFARIGQRVKLGESVQITNFGVFERGTRAAYSAHNPKTMEAIEVAAQNRLKFRASKVLKAMLN